eukprot:gene4273-4564_t
MGEDHFRSSGHSRHYPIFNYVERSHSNSVYLAPGHPEYVTKAPELTLKKGYYADVDGRQVWVPYSATQPPDRSPLSHCTSLVVFNAFQESLGTVPQQRLSSQCPAAEQQERPLHRLGSGNVPCAAEL